MVRISACVIAKNEAENIARCLQSVKPVVNEMIVVDTGSSDDTVNIARELGAKIFYYQWNHDFAAARNYALKQAKGDWIIFLDADEYIVAGKIPNVRPFIEQAHANPVIESVICLMENTSGLDGTLRGCNPTVRIFRNSREIRYEGKVHEAIYKKGKPTKAVMDSEQAIVIRHTGYTRVSFASKLERNNALLEEELKQGIVRDLTYHYLCDGYWKLGRYEKALAFARQAIERNFSNTMMAHKPYVVQISSMVHLGTYPEAAIEEMLAEALRKFAHHPEIILQQAIFYMNNGRYRSALEAFRQAVAANDNYNDLKLNNEFPGQRASAHRNLARLYDLMNDPVTALDCYVKALQYDKYDREAFYGLIALVRRQRPADIVFLLNKLYDIGEEKDVEFLAARLSEVKVRTVLDYYQNIWSETFGHQEYGGFVVLCAGKYEPAFRYFAANFRDGGSHEAERLAALALLLGGELRWMEELGPELSPSLGRIIHSFFQTEMAGSLAATDLSCYLELLVDVANLGDSGQLNRFVAIGKTFDSDEAVRRIGELLMKLGLFASAFELYWTRIHSAGSETGRNGAFYCLAGLCRYKARDYAGAADCFARALESGYQGHDLFEFIEWSIQQSADNALKDKLQLLKRSCENHEVGSIAPSLNPRSTDRWPRVSIIIPTYNQKDFLKEALESALAQDYRNLEIIVGDDHSTDGTDKVMQHYAKADNRIKYIRHNENLGPGNNSSYLLYNHTDAKYFMILNHDDYLIKNDYISQAVDFLSDHPNVSFVWANCRMYNNETGKFTETNFKRESITNGVEYFLNYESGKYTHVTGVLTSVFDRGKAIAMKCLQERTKSKDVFLYLKMMLTGDVGFFEDKVAVYRIHRNSISYNMPPEFDYPTLEELENLRNIALQKGLPDDALQRWINTRVCSYIKWRFVTLWNQKQKKYALELLWHVAKQYPPAYEMIVATL
jgi:glycosyltransferase involved in cell wall biosynthesis